jgi:hypothetical protein
LADGEFGVREVFVENIEGVGTALGAETGEQALEKHGPVLAGLGAQDGEIGWKVVFAEAPQLGRSACGVGLTYDVGLHVGRLQGASEHSK